MIVFFESTERFTKLISDFSLTASLFSKDWDCQHPCYLLDHNSFCSISGGRHCGILNLFPDQHQTLQDKQEVHSKNMSLLSTIFSMRTLPVSLCLGNHVNLCFRGQNTWIKLTAQLQTIPFGLSSTCTNGTLS